MTLAAALSLLGAVLPALPAHALRRVTVGSIADLKQAVAVARPGDVIELGDGTYSDAGTISIERGGTTGNPVTVRAGNRGGARFTGAASLVVRKTACVVIEGFVFETGAGPAVSTEASREVRITRNVFRLRETAPGHWVRIDGPGGPGEPMSDHNRIDHNRFEGKTLAGCFVVIDGSGKPDPRSSQYDRIDHNHFRDTGPRIENGKEAVRLGWSGMSRTSGFTTVEHNLFEDCDGDPEIVSVKTCDDTVRHNTVRRSQGSVTLRAGNRSTVEGNFFLGGGKAGTGGVRIHGDDHRVFNNYFEGLTGTGCSAPLSIPAGDADPDTSLDYRLHFPARRARVAFNTLVANARAIEIGTGCVAGAHPPADLVLEGNLVTGDGAGLERTVAAAGGALWRDNLMWPTGAGAVAIAATPGIVIADPRLVRAGELWRIGPASPAIDAAQELAWVPTDMDGQRRDRPDIGADEYATGPALVYPLARGDVGPDAFEVGRPVVTGRMPAIAVDPVVHANAPNPFSVATRIDFTLPVGGPVELAVYDVEGRRIASLVDGPLAAGRQSVEWRPSGIPPGIYHLRLRVGASIATRTMLYLR